MTMKATIFIHQHRATLVCWRSCDDNTIDCATLPMTSQMSWQFWRAHVNRDVKLVRYDIDFIHGDIHGQWCKKTQYWIQHWPYYNGAIFIVSLYSLWFLHLQYLCSENPNTAFECNIYSILLRNIDFPSVFVCSRKWQDDSSSIQWHLLIHISQNVKVSKKIKQSYRGHSFVIAPILHVKDDYKLVTDTHQIRSNIFK